MDWQKTALALWKLLDDIDTLDDAARDNDRAFRDCVRKFQQRRFDILDGSEYELRCEQYQTQEPD